MVFTPRPYEEHTLRPVDRMTISDLLLLGGYEATDVLADVLGLLFTALDVGIISLDLASTKVSETGDNCSPERSGLATAQFLEKYKNGDYIAVVATAPEIDKPLVLVESEGCYRLYFQKYYCYESRLKEQMKAFRSASVVSPPDNLTQLIQSLSKPQRVLRKGEDQMPLVADPNQMAAISHALKSQLTIISGGPGTGKTTVVANLLRCLVESGIAPERMLLAAPTGRAAQRMTETLKTLLQTVLEPTLGDNALQSLQGQTLHNALQYRHPGQFVYSSNNPLPMDVVVVDEASMVDVVLMSQFVSALDPSTTRLVLLGDPDQLPAVAAGSIFARMTASDEGGSGFSGYQVVLEKGFRSGSALTLLAQEIRQGAFPEHQPEAVQAAFSEDSTTDWCRLESTELKHWPLALKAWANLYQHNFNKALRKELQDLRHISVTAFSQPDSVLSDTIAKLLKTTTVARILTLVRKGPWGCEEINAFLTPHLANALDQGGDPAMGVFAGMPLMMTRNDKENSLCNGDVGVVVSLKEGYYVVFQSSGGFVALPVSHLSAWEPAMAITVHKSQGSEYQQVFLVLPDDSSHRLLSREMIYTAVTRAQKQLVIWGDEKVLRRAVSKRAVELVDTIFD